MNATRQRPQRASSAEVFLAPDQYAIALAESVRISMPDVRPPRVVILREIGTRRWACCRAMKQARTLSPVIKRAEPLPKVKSYAVLAWPPLWEEQ